jgi:hypothetical protein
MTMADDLSAHISMSRDICKQQILEAKSTRKLLKFLIAENATDEKMWGSSLMPLLCEYYSTLNQYVKLLLEIFVSADRSPEDPEILKIKPRYADLLRSQASLMLLNDHDLLYKYRISLTVH